MSDQISRQLVNKTKMIKASVEPESKCYEVFSTVIFTSFGAEMVVASASKDDLSRFLELNRCGHFDEKRYQEVAIFSSKSVTDRSEVDNAKS